MCKKFHEIKNVRGDVILAYEIQEQDDLTNLNQISLEYAASERIPLNCANLEGFELNNANLENLEAPEANMKGVVIKNSNLNGANLYNAELQQSKIINTSIINAYIQKADCSQSIFLRVNLAKTNISGSNYNGALIKNSNFSDVENTIGIASFEGAFVFNTDFKRSSLPHAYLNKAKFIFCDFENAKLDCSQVTDTKFKFTNLSKTNLEGALGSKTEFDNSPLHETYLRKSSITNFIVNNQSFPRHILFHKIEDIAYMPNRITTSYSESDSMIEAIKNRDQDAIKSLKEQHSQKYGDSIKYDVSGRSLSNTNLSGLDLSGIDFSGCNFTGVEAKGTNFNNSILDGVMFGSNPKTEKISNLSGATFNGASLDNLYLSKCLLNGTKFNNSSLVYAQFTECSGNDVGFGNSKLFKPLFKNQTSITNAYCDLSEITHATFNDGVFQGTFKSAEIYSTNFIKIDLGNSVFKGAQISGLNLIESNGISSDFSNANLKLLHITSSNLQNSTFDSTCIYKSVVTDSDLSNTSFIESQFKKCDLSSVDIKGSDLNQSCFIETNIEDVNYQDAKNIPASLKSIVGESFDDNRSPRELAEHHLHLLRDKLRTKDNSEYNLSM